MLRRAAFFLVALGIIGTCCGAAFADTPHEIAGIRLGEDVSRYADRLRMDKAIVVRQMEYLSEVEMKPVEGYRSGYVTYAGCKSPGRVARMKMKYEREDREFYDELLTRFKKRFGEPSQYKGDPFKTVIAWKWSFTDKDNNRISMILQHNTTDDDESTSGNSLKLTMTSLIDEERECHKKKHPRADQNGGREGNRNTNFDAFIPQE